MSSLIFQTQPDLVLVAADTLAVSLDERLHPPHSFTSKVEIVPHLRVILAGTGDANLCNKWFFQVKHQMLVDDIDHLNFHTPSALIKLSQRHEEEVAIKNGSTTTIYHFGISASDDTVHSYAYRSTNDFQSEEMAYGLRYKPECDLPEKAQLPKDIRTLMDSQRAIQATIPPETRIHIGGEIQLYILSRDGYQVQTIDRFEDYEDMKRQVYANFKKVAT